MNGLAAALALLWVAPAQEPRREGTDPGLLEALRSYPHRLAYESWRESNWEILICRADGSGAVNLTKTPEVDELYPKASPDGTRICFVADEGPPEARRRNLYLMNADGTGRTRIGENARDPCWSPDGRRIAYLGGEFEKHTVIVFATKKAFVYDLETRRTLEHPNPGLEHLFSLDWSPDGKWLVTTVHGGMGYKHAIVAVEADGARHVDLKLPGCRPDLGPGGRKVVWGHGDFAIGVADLDWAGAAPAASNLRKIVVSQEPFMTYHMDWSPEGRYIAFTRGPKSTQKALVGATRETPGVKAPGWDLCIADAAGENRWIQITLDGLSNKEPDWVAAPVK
jgi:Tol biopolymer transport system component